MSSWKTTVMGICTILSILSGVAIAFLDGNAATNPDWTTAVAGLTTAAGLIFARDNNKTSEDVRAK